jgi:hypothetical protein
VVGVAEVVEDREDDAPVAHGAPEVGEGVGHALHLAAVVTHREVALPCGMERREDLRGTGIGVATELVLERLPDLAHVARGTVGRTDGVLELRRDGPHEPGHDDGVEA